MGILELRIYSCRLKEQLDFYKSILGLPLLDQNDKEFTVKIGNTQLTFVGRAEASPYHFAINIPSYKETEALIWLKSRVEILPWEGKEIINFQNWNARSIYFHDADQNIVELIARRDLQYKSDKLFSSWQFQEISEIGMLVTNIQRTYEKLQRWTGIEIFDGSFKAFCAIGDEKGLFICIDKAKDTWFPTNEKALPSTFEISFAVQGKTYRMKYINHEIHPL